MQIQLREFYVGSIIHKPNVFSSASRQGTPLSLVKGWADDN